MDNPKLPAPFISFSRKVFFLGSRYLERNKAEDELKSHLNSIKEFSLNKKQRRIARELDKTESKITALVEKEKKLFNAVMGKHRVEMNNVLMKRIDVLEHHLLLESEAKKMAVEKNRVLSVELSSMVAGLKKRLRNYIGTELADKERKKKTLKHINAKIKGVDVHDYLGE